MTGRQCPGVRRAARAVAALVFAATVLGCGDDAQDGCEPGSEGCACRAVDAAVGEDDRPAGEADSGAGEGACDAPLSCIEDVCQDRGRDAGDEDASVSECRPNGRCDDGSRCDPDTDTCVPCMPGSEGCNCDEDERCDDALACSAGLCVTEEEPPPQNPRCYTPCRADLVEDGEVRACDSDHLMAGCVGDRQCVDGACLLDDEERPSCEQDSDCPFFQACTEGACYAQCETNAECAMGHACFQRTCRLPCQTSMPGQCGTNQRCEAPDGENGYCLPLSESSAESASLPKDTFTLSVPDLAFSNVRTSGSFQVLPSGGSARTFTVRKLKHTLIEADGSTETVVAPEGDCDAARGECPLSWLELSAGTSTAREAALTVQSEAGCESDTCPTVTIANAAGSPGVRWEGELEVSSPGSPIRVLTLRYAERAEGQYVGKMYYFGTFNGDEVDNWLARGDRGQTSNLGNGLLARWGAFRSGNLQGGWSEMVAVLNATETESWRFGEVQRRCRELSGSSSQAACYPFGEAGGVRTYVTDASVELVPTGVTTLPFALNLRPDSNDPARLLGRVETAQSLHYAGNPAIELILEANPQASGACARGIEDCAVFLSRDTPSPASTLVAGGRYVTTAQTCDPGFGARELPWLLPDFLDGTSVGNDGARSRRVCNDVTAPYADTVMGAEALNANLSAANPVPDGRARTRTLELLDGALVNQRVFVLLFRERFESLLAGERASAYGYIVLHREPADVAALDADDNGVPDAFESVPAEPSEAVPTPMQGLACDPDLLNALGVTTSTLADGSLGFANAGDAVRSLITGSTPAGAGTALTGVHYFCEDTGLFDGGPDPAARIPCPEGSRVSYFTLDVSRDLSAEPCQQGVRCEGVLTDPMAPPACTGGTCQATLAAWIAAGDAGPIAEPNPFYRCRDAADTCAGTPALTCDDRADLTAGKCFYEPPAGGSFSSIRSEIAEAFRYKVRFRSRTGDQVGFAPQICIPNSDQIPYCYEPERIEQVRKRLDCLVHIHTHHYGSLNDPAKSELSTFLSESFSQFDVDGTAGTATSDGFEHMYAELLVMLGDEALTAAFASRFDLAGAGNASFFGTAFEGALGIDLSGLAGFELAKLYQAAQYYQQVVDRLYQMGPDLDAALARDSAQSFVSQAMVTRYLNRVINAATQKARAYREAAVRYRGFNRPELARAVIEREYTATYLESALLSDLLQHIEVRLSTAERSQVRRDIEQAQRRYRMTLLEMRDVYSDITSELTYFGFPPDYVPFPALDTASFMEQNAVEVMLRLAENKLLLAKQREQSAIDADRSFNTDAAQFQAELVRVRNTYEAQLQELCGSFEATDGRLYPAIRKYAELDDTLRSAGDPCGLLGNGAVFEKLLEIGVAATAFRAQLQEFDNKLAQIANEEQRLTQQCAEIDSLADLRFVQRGMIRDIEHEIAGMRTQMEFQNRMMSAGGNLAMGLANAVSTALTTAASGGANPLDQAVTGAAALGAGAALATGAAVQFALETAVAVTSRDTDTTIANRQSDIRDLEAQEITFEGESQCRLATIDSVALVKSHMLDLMRLQIEGLQRSQEAQIRKTELVRLRNQARRLQDEQAESEALLINVEAARSDPNVRIYRNDAVVNADFAFQDALAWAYQATKVFEYYTSRSYERLDQLFLVRMAAVGEYNLENYLIGLRNAFFEFEQSFGLPDTRVLALSLKNDLLRIPYTDEAGAPLGAFERTERMRAALRDVRMLDGNGYITIPFGTSFEQLSPLTRDHKLLFVEANFEGSNLGDTVARAYLRMLGTGVIHDVDGNTDTYVFPERTAVLNPFFNGNRLFQPEVYKSPRLRDRPLVNTAWQLVLNLRDEAANEDLDLSSLDDIRLYAYYQDFTAL